MYHLKIGSNLIVDFAIKLHKAINDGSFAAVCTSKNEDGQIILSVNQVNTDLDNGL